MTEPAAADKWAWPSELLVFAAETRAALREQLRACAADLAATPAQPLAHTALRCAETVAQTAGAHRLALLVDDWQDGVARITRALQYLDDPQRTRFNVANRVMYEAIDPAAPDPVRTTALLFPGFGAWHPSLVADLYRHFHSAHAWIDGLDAATRRSILENPQLFPASAAAGGQPRDEIKSHAKAQRREESSSLATLSTMAPEESFAAMMGAVLAGDLVMHTLLSSGFGLRAGALAGHSYGENAMLLASGMVQDYRFIADLMAGLTAAMRRAYRSQPTPLTGGALLALPAAAYAALDPALTDAVHLALDNCPQQVVIYGAPVVIAAIEAQMQAQGVAAFRLPALDQPVHTPIFPVSSTDLSALYADLAIAAPRAGAAVYSCATAARFPDAPAAIRALLSAQWHQPVQFRATIEQMAADGVRTFVEVGPGGRLTGFVRDILLRGRGESGQPGEILPVAANIESRTTLLQLQTCLAQLFVRGHALDLRRLVTDRRQPEEAAAPAARTPTTSVVRPALSTPVPPDALAVRLQQQAVLAAVLADAAAILDLTDPAALDPEQGFFDLGMGSLQAVELVARLAQRFDLPLAQTLAFDYPTPRQLAHYLHALLHPDAAGAAAHPASAATASDGAAATDGIAIVGMGCRFPGGVDSPAAFWELLRSGRDAIVARPAGRWPEETEAWLTDADEVARIRYGGYLADIEHFDAAFFGISPREAETLDPQQRLLLEVVWEALEQGAFNPRDLAGSRTGVFVGISHADYALRLTPAERLAISGYLATGNTASTAAGRIAFLLGLHGPCLAVDTACSSSLVALHLACQSLRQRECDIALVAGVNLLVAPESSVFLSKALALAVDGRCKTFDAEANGYVRGEGCGVVVLKRLADAQAAGDNTLAVVRGTAMNHDGRTSGLTVPSGPAQQAVVRQALAAAGVAPADVDFVECHGTGTSLGDPIEVQALGQVFGQDGARAHPLLLGAVKTNIGHLEAAAGIAGLLKLVLQLQHGALAPNLHFHTPNPKVDWARLPLRVCTAAQPWPGAGQGDARPRVGGVSSFGISGTNAHAILEAAPRLTAGSADAATPAIDAAASPQVLTLSARTPAALAALTAKYLEFLEPTADGAALPLADICATTTLGRAHFEARCAVVAATLDDAREQLRERGGAVPARTAARPRPVIAFLCSGQGSQYPGMARRLFATEPVFRQVLEECDAGLRPYLGRSILRVIFDEGRGARGEERVAEGEEPLHTSQFTIHNSQFPGQTNPQSPNPPISQSPIHQTLYTQPTLFAIEYALARQWQAWGVQPDYLLGHSIGEYAAACLAGVFSFADALRLVAARGRLMQSLPAGGAMLAVLAAAPQVEAVLAAAGAQDTLAIAAINGPANTVLSGAAAAIDRAAELLAAAGVRTSRLTVSHAFHSPLMEPILAEFAAVAATVTYAPPQLPVVTNRTGHLANAANPAEDLATPAYWVRQLREPVYFARGLQTLVEKGCNVLLEIGPKPVLIGMGQQTYDGLHTPADLLWLASLQQPQDDQEQMLTSLAALYARGGEIDWRRFHQSRTPEDPPQRRAVLPTYPFQRERFWIDVGGSDDGAYLAGAATPGSSAPPLLGAPIDLPGAPEQLRFEHRPSGRELALFAAYLTGGDRTAAPTRRARLPLAALLTLLHSAGRTCFPDGTLHITNIELDKPLPLKLSAASTLQTVLTPQADGSYACAVYSRRQLAGVWTLLASAAIAQGGPADAAGAALPPAPAGDAPTTAIAPQDFYAVSRQLGFVYGAPFQVLRTLHVGAQAAAALVQAPDDERAARLPALAPVLLLDGAFQALGAVLFQPYAPGLHSVARIAALTFAPAAWPTAAAVTVACTWPPAAGAPPAAQIARMAATVTLRDPVTGAPVAEIAGIGFTAVALETGAEADADAGEAATPVAAGAGAWPGPLQDVLAAAASDRLRLVTRRIRKLMANVMGIARDRPIAEDSPFNQLGLDSLLALRLRNAVQADYWVDIPLARYVTDLSTATLATTILAQIDWSGLQDGAGTASPPAAAGGLAAEEWVEGEL